jgi:hypothetical protein
VSKDKFFDVDLGTVSTLFHRRKTEGVAIGRGVYQHIPSTVKYYQPMTFVVGCSFIRYSHAVCAPLVADAPAPKYESFSLMGMLGGDDSAGHDNEGGQERGFTFLKDDASEDEGDSTEDDMDGDHSDDVRGYRLQTLLVCDVRGRMCSVDVFCFFLETHWPLNRPRWPAAA